MLRRFRRLSWRNFNDYCICFMVLLILIIFYRGFIYFYYNIKYFDNDQAVMWDATAAYASFIVPEPFFWGQAYGGMFESLIAVPFYWMKIPLNYAVPLATILISMFPTLYTSIILWRKNKRLASCLILIFVSLTGWQSDILMSIPRCFIGGFPFAVLGSIIMYESQGKPYKVFLGSFLASLSVVITNNAVVIATMGFMIFTLENYRKPKLLLNMIAGGLISLLLYVVLGNFYSINSDYLLHPSISLDYSLENLRNNIPRIKTILSELFMGGFVWIPIVMLVTILFLIYKRKWKLVIVVLINIALNCFLLCLSKSNDYGEHTVLFCQSRMFLHLLFAALPVFYYGVMSLGSDCSQMCKSKYLYFGVLIVAAVLVVKGGIINGQLNNPNSDLNTGCTVGIMSTDKIINEASKINQFAEKTGADVIVDCDNNLCLSYAFDALYWGKYTVYSVTYDRRTWNYHKLLHADRHNCVFFRYDWDRGGELVLENKDINDQSVVDYIFEVYGLKRNPY